MYSFFWKANDEILQAIKNKDKDLLKKILNKEPDKVYFTNHYGNLIHNAIIEGCDEDIISILIVAGADVNAINEEQATPIHYAIDSKKINIVRLLLDNKAEIDAQDEELVTPLHNAVIMHDYDTVKLLLEKGADPKIKEYDGYMPIDIARALNYDKIIELFNKYDSN